MKYIVSFIICINSLFVFADGFLGPDTAICPPCVTLKMPSGSNYSWSTGETSQSISVCTDTTIEIWASYEDISADPVEVYKDTIVVNLLASYPDTTIYSNNIKVCIGDCKVINAPSNGYQYTWSTSIGLDDSTIQNPTVCLMSDTVIYNVTVIMDAGLKCQYIFPLNVIAAPIAEAIQPNYEICKDSCVILQAPTNGQKFIWSPNSNINNIYSQIPEVCLSEDMEYVVITETDTILNCSYNDTISISVKDTCMGTSVLSLHTNIISCFPNPTSDFININIPYNNKNIKISIVNELGKLVYFENSNIKLNYIIDINDLAEGLYFLQLFDGVNQYSENILILE